MEIINFSYFSYFIHPYLVCTVWHLLYGDFVNAWLQIQIQGVWTIQHNYFISWGWQLNPCKYTNWKKISFFNFISFRFMTWLTKEIIIHPLFISLLFWFDILNTYLKSIWSFHMLHDDWSVECSDNQYYHHWSP